MTSTPSPIVEFNPFLLEFKADPYPFYHRLRSEDPVHLTPMGFWVLTRYDDIVAVLRDQRFGRKGFEPLLEARFGTEPGQPGMATSMLFRDPPDHTRLRALVNRAFTPRVIEALRPRIQQLVDELLDQTAPRGSMDLIRDLAYPLTVTVICEMLGVPGRDRDIFRQWSVDSARAVDAITLTIDPAVIERGNRAREALIQYFQTLIAERRRDLRDDLLSGLIIAEEEGDKLSEAELIATCILLLLAGHETTVNLIGNGMLALLRHPAEWRRLRADPTLISSAIEELLRYDSPVQRTGRMPTTDVEIGGKRIPAGVIVSLQLGAANRDPAHFAAPDRLDLARSDNRHIAFGWGIHFCLGAPLARVEGQIAIGALAQRLQRLALAVDVPQWRDSLSLRGLESLPVTFSV